MEKNYVSPLYIRAEIIGRNIPNVPLGGKQASFDVFFTQQNNRPYEKYVCHEYSKNAW